MFTRVVIVPIISKVTNNWRNLDLLFLFWLFNPIRV